jgi:heme exporter protein D
MPEAAVIAAVIEKATLVGVLAWGVIAFVRGWIVPASVHRAVLEDRREWQARHDRIAQIAEMSLRARVGMGS